MFLSLQYRSMNVKVLLCSTAMSRGFSGGKNAMKADNARNRGRVGVFSQKETVLALQNGVLTSLTLVLLAARTSTVPTSSRKKWQQ